MSESQEWVTEIYEMSKALESMYETEKARADGLSAWVADFKRGLDVVISEIVSDWAGDPQVPANYASGWLHALESVRDKMTDETGVRDA